MFHIPTPAEQHHRQDTFRDALPPYRPVDEAAIRAAFRRDFAVICDLYATRPSRGNLGARVVDAIRLVRRGHTASIHRERGRT